MTAAPDFTRNPQQEIAADPAGSAWVSASAGSGKTHVLTNRVVRLLLDGALPYRILCLTFTKAAAAEMSNRIKQRLASWVSMPEDKLKQELLQLGIENPDGNLLVAARELFVRVLDAPGGLQISTIHAFCQSLMARFPLEADIAPHFAVMDDRTSAELKTEARKQVFAKAGQDNSDLSAAIDFLTAHVAETKFQELVDKMLSKDALFTNAADVHEAEGQWRITLGIGRWNGKADLVQEACGESSYSKPMLLTAVDALKCGSKSEQERAAAIEDWLNAPEQRRIENFNAYTLLFLTQSQTPRQKKPTKAAMAELETLPEILLDEALRLQGVADLLAMFDVVESSRHLFIFAKEMMSIYDQLKRDAGLMDFADLIKKARQLVENSAPWVLYKLDGGLDHILVDEAQDTNADQWSIVRSLADAFFDQLEPDRTRTVFAVGDPKQSIYRFQGAMPREFEYMRQYFGDTITPSGQAFNDAVLDLSYRSTQAVLDVVDATFALPGAADGLQLAATAPAIKHHAFRRDVAGKVSLWEPEANNKDDQQAPERWQLPVQQISDDPPYARLARRIAEQVGEWIDSKTVLAAKGRPIEAGDILILVRRRNEFFDAMVNALKAKSIDVAGMDRMVLNEQLVIMDLVALGRFALMPNDDLTLATVLKSPLFGLDDSHLIELAPNRDGSLLAALKDAAAGNGVYANTLAQLREVQQFANLRPFDFYGRVLSELDGRMKLLSRLGPEAEDPLDEFINLSLDYERDHTPSLEGFLHWLEASDTEVKRELEQAQGQVRVMTVHGAKGLQAPIVFLPDTINVPTATTTIYELDTDPPLPLWSTRSELMRGPAARLKENDSQADQQEYHRQLYVGLTRAEDELYICGYLPLKIFKIPGNCWYTHVANAFDTMDGVTEDLDAAGRSIRTYTTGHKSDGTAKSSTTPDQADPVPDWALAPPAPEPTPVRPLMPSRPSGNEVAVRSPLEGVQDNHFKRGLLIHKLLEILPEIATEGRRHNARALLAQPANGLDAETIEQWVEEVMVILDDPAFAPLFGPDSLAEVALSGLVGDTPVSGVVDRLVVESDRIMVVDYKTNRPPPKQAQSVPGQYLAQMATYQKLLQQIYPEAEIQCALLWTDGPTLMQLPQDMLDTTPDEHQI